MGVPLGPARRVFTTDYDLGEFVRVEQVLGGYVNLSFAIWADDGSGERRYFVRKYNRAITEREVRFEHALVSHINSRGFHMAAKVFPTKAGGTFVTREEVLDGEPLVRFFAVYEMLSGEDKYTWVKNRCSDRSSRARRACWPTFITALTTSTPEGWRASSRPSWTCCAACRPRSRAARPRRPTHAVTSTSSPSCRPSSRSSKRGPRSSHSYRGMPFIPVHGDFHPGNLKWVDQEAVAMRPVEWSGVLVLRFLRLRLVEARLPGLRRGPRGRVLLQLVGRAGQGGAAARQGRRLRARLPGRGGALDGPGTHERARARRAAADDRQRQPLRPELGRHRLLRR